MTCQYSRRCHNAYHQSSGQYRDIAKDTVVIAATHYQSRIKKLETLFIVLKLPTGEITYVIAEMNHVRRRVSFLPTFKDLTLDVTHQNIFVPGSEQHRPLDLCQKRLSEKYDALCTVTLTRPMSLARLAILLRVFSACHSILIAELLKSLVRVYCLRAEFGGDITENRLQSRQGKDIGVKIGRENSVEAIAKIYKCAWMALWEEMRSRQAAAEIIRQIDCTCDINSLTIVP
jgi:hypothetical protein